MKRIQAVPGMMLIMVVLCGLAAGSTHAQSEEKGEPRQILTGNLRVDLFGMDAMRQGPLLDDAPQDMARPEQSHKSPWLAGVLSLLVPGSGEVYAESYWKAALFVAVEVTAWSIALSNDKKGNDQTSLYQNFANGHWSVVKYAQYAQGLAPSGRTYNWRIAGTEGMDPWDRPWIQVNWSELNRMERDIAGYYSHTLPPYGEQQYFELIGKYPQFNQGWNDAPPAFNYGDPLTSNFLWYANERGKANTYYTNATRWVTIAVINHVLSAVDGAWSAHLYNRAQISTSMRMVPTLDGTTMFGSVKVSWGI